MWQNNSFGNNGQLPANFNQDEYTPSPFMGLSGQPFPGQQLFPQQPQNMMPFDDNGEGFMSNSFQPEVGLYNEGAFMQNHFPPQQAQFAPSPFAVPQAPASTTPRPTQINARAMELKAQLLKGRENRASSSTPPVVANGKTKQPETAERTNSSDVSPKGPATSAGKEIDIDKLISEFSGPNEAADASVKQDNKNGDTSAATLQQPPKRSDPPAKSPASSLGSPTKIAKPVSNVKPFNTNNSLGSRSRHASNGSEISEGEILESPPPSTKSSAPKKADGLTISNNTVGLPTRRREDLSAKPPQGREIPPESPARHSNNSKAQPPRTRDDRREETQLRVEKRPFQSDKQERRPYLEPERKSYSRREARDQPEEHRRADTMDIDQKEESRVVAHQPPPTLAQLLPLDANLREWLEITGYHNAPYRDKILATRRKIAALDAQRDALVAEMAMDERSAVQGPAAAAMLPPPVPNRAGDRAEPALNGIPGDRTASNKRPYSEVQEPREDGTPGKLARIDDRPRIKNEDDDRRPKSGDYELSRRNSNDYHRDDRDHRREDGRTRGRGNSRERDVSPGRRAYESRPPARPRYADEDRDEPSARREFVMRGGYRGRAYDPNFRGRGRGRGDREFREREDHGSNPGPFPREELRVQPYGSTIASTKPYKNTKGFSRGGRGDTRYFIVKSFNEDNVLRCIEDSIWTTQLHVGEILREAFQTCKNVILVFSINKSKAFQGYARMESLPGSVDMPSWQRAINWESAGAFKVRWLCICATRFHRIGHLKNSLNENQAVLIGKDGQEIEEYCGQSLIALIDEEAEQQLLNAEWDHDERRRWDD